jgi:hypothetical protein
MVMVAVTLCEGTADELASMVTVPPGGMEAGAIKVVGTPLAVWRVSEPQSTAGPPHVKSQLTPRLVVSLVTLAANCTEELAIADEGGAICPWAKAIVTGAAALLVLHPLKGMSAKPHNINARPRTARMIRPFETDSRFISIFSTSSRV